MAIIHPTKYYCTVSYSQKYYYIIAIYNNNYSAEMKERCRDGCRTSLLIAGVVLVPAIFHTLLPPCHPYITIHFMEMIFSTCTLYKYKLTDTGFSISSKTRVTFTNVATISIGTCGIQVTWIIQAFINFCI